MMEQPPDGDFSERNRVRLTSPLEQLNRFEIDGTEVPLAISTSLVGIHYEPAVCFEVFDAAVFPGKQSPRKSAETL
jgi:hypothetical protein